MIDQKYKGRFCGYCGEWIHGNYETFDNHLNYCEMVMAHKIEMKRKGILAVQVNQKGKRLIIQLYLMWRKNNENKYSKGTR